MKAIDALRKAYLNLERTLPQDLKSILEIEIVKVVHEATLQEEITACTACFLHENCSKKVPGKGPMPADIMMIGEAPSEIEDLAGEPFMGPSGDMFNKILTTMGWSREDIYITNVLKCMPPKGHTLHQAELAMCRKHLLKEIELVNPKVIICWGATPANVLIHPDFRITQEIGHWFEDNGRRLMAVYSPAYVLRQEEGSAKQNTIKWDIWRALEKVKAYKDTGFDPNHF